MPIQYLTSPDKASDPPEALFRWDGSEPVFRAILWPHRSLPPSGFVWFIAITCAMLSLPLLALLGTMALWGLLPFILLAIAGIWFGLTRSYASARLIEEISLWPDQMSLVRVDPSGARREWQGNPYWVTLHSRETPVEHYLTLQGGEREVELGAFLSPDERRELHHTVEDHLRALGPNQAGPQPS